MPMVESKFNKIKGQSLIELLIALGISAIFIVGMTSAFQVSLQTGSQNEFMQSASLLAQEELDGVAVTAQSDWHKVGLKVSNPDPNDDLTASLKYYVNTGVTPFVIISAESPQVPESKTVGAVTYGRYFIPEAVYRNINGDIGSGFGYTLDPATIKITAYVTWNNSTQNISVARYINRVGNRIFRQTDWSGGPQVDQQFTGKENIFSSMSPVDGIDYSTEVGAITVKNISNGGANGAIDNVKRYAWNDAIGWIDFKPITNPCVGGDIVVSGTAVTGCASSSVGPIVLDCAHSPTTGLNCVGYPNWKVSNTTNGLLSGYAWNDAVGWISFDHNQGGYSYRVSIISGNFEGYAWNNVIGWISFNCDHTNPGGATSPTNLPAICGTSNYLVRTNWNVPANSTATLTSSIFDTGIAQGAVINSVMWIGDQNGGSVQLYLASSNSATGPWVYTGPYNISSSSSAVINISDHYNKRYFRYQAVMQTAGSNSPKVRDVIINWTP